MTAGLRRDAPLLDVHALLALLQADARALLEPRARRLSGLLRVRAEGSVKQRDRKLAEMAETAYGLKHGIAAFDERIEEMGPGVAARAAGRGGKGSHGTPVEAEAVEARRPTVVTSKLDRLVDKAHAALVDLEAEYRRIAQPHNGLPTKGEGSCEWCETAARAWRNAATKVGDEDAAERSPVAVHRCRPYLFARVEREGGKTAKVLVCEWCYRFWRREGRPPTTEELWLHAQGLRVLVKPAKPGRKARMRAAERASANGS